MPTLDIQQIKELLPHRYPFLLVDKVLSYEKYKNITAIKNITMNEPCFLGHFPEKPIFPGVLIIEALAQTAALLGCVSLDEKPDDGTLYYLVGVDNVRFKRPVGPGEQLLLDVNFDKVRKNVWKFNATATVEGNFVASADLLTTVLVP